MKDSCQRQTWIAGSALLLAVLALTGCGGDRVYPVEGKVIYHPDGRAAVELVGCTIDFDPITEDKKLGATGVINKDGSFTVGTHTGDDGAVAGKHRVAISPPSPQDDRPSPPSPIPERYRSFDQSGLVVEIKPERNKVVLEVEPVKRQVKNRP